MMARVFEACGFSGWSCSCPQTIIPNAWRHVVFLFGSRLGFDNDWPIWEDWIFEDEWLYQQVCA